MNGEQTGREDVEALRQRILNAPPPVTAELLDRLRRLPDVAAARETWFHGWVQIDVDLGAWNEDTWHGAHDLIDAFARPYVGEFSVVGRVNLPEHPPAAVAARPAGEDKARPCPSPVCDYPDHGWRPSAPSSPVPDEVREEIARAIAESHPWCEPWDSLSDAPGDTLRNEFRKTADAVLATPVLRRAIAERDEARAAVERVRTVLAKAERDAEQSSARMFDGRPFPPSVWHEDLRRALDGDEP